MKFGPHKLFILDGIGALLSAFMLGVVLVQFQTLFGIPTPTLYFLSAIPIGLALLDLIFYSIPTKHGVGLKVMALLNVVYCIISLSLITFHADLIIVYGWLYILSEIVIILCLSRLEWSSSTA